MAQSLSQIYIHLVFHIKNDGIALLEDDCPKMFAYIDGILRNKGSFVIQIGGMPDHIHILCTLPRTISTADFVEDIKKCSSKWVKTIDSRYSKFAWQGGYGVFSVSDSQLEKTKQYILNQKEHHKKMTFHEEYLDFLKHYHIEYNEEYLFTD
ncbi:MAG: transposase [Bacteroidales bacterium]|nr:transposase [Bacteroidales bacterium]